MSALRGLTLGFALAHASAAAAPAELELAAIARAMQWEAPAEPMRIVGPVHFVGTQGLGAWLITTSAGHFLLNSGMPSSGPQIEASIRKLGFDPDDVALLLTSHAHVDHVGGHAYLARVTGAEVAAIDAAAELLRSGGGADFHYAGRPGFAFEPVTPRRILTDGATLTLGEIAMTAWHTPGHTRGGSTWTTEVVDGGKRYVVVFPDSASVNAGYRVARDPSYPGIGDDFRRTLGVLEGLKPDVWLPAHAETHGFAEKRARAAHVGASAWADPEGYRRFVAAQRQRFEARVAAELAAASLQQ